jgi:hypothetical protein
MREAIKAARLFLAGAVLVLSAGFALSESWWDTPQVRACCSQADAVWADRWTIEGDTIRATVTGGGPREHEWAPIGREYIVPRDKWLDLPGNPTGRPMLFINPHHQDHVFCFAMGPLI